MMPDQLSRLRLLAAVGWSNNLEVMGDSSLLLFHVSKNIGD
jgi:hypothetical protein